MLYLKKGGMVTGGQHLKMKYWKFLEQQIWNS